jgi:hypothetical protein
MYGGAGAETAATDAVVAATAGQLQGALGPAGTDATFAIVP